MVEGRDRLKQPEVIFEADIVDNKLKMLDHVRQAISRYVSTFKNGTKVNITIKKHKKKRTNLQNAYYFGTVVPILSEHFGYDIEEMHEELKYLFNPVQSKIDPDRKIGYSTTKMSTIEFFHDEDSYVERICRWAATEYGVYIPPPKKDDYAKT